MSDESFRPALERLIADEMGAGAELVTLEALSGGASRQTFSLDVLDPAGARRRLILQRDTVARLRTGGGMGVEAAVLRSAAAAGVPVPTLVAASGGEELLGTPFLLSERIDGETIARRILRDEDFSAARRALVGQLGRAAAAIHRMEPVDGLEHTDQLGRYRELLDELGAPVPTFELALRWLDEHRPSGRPVGVVHGDFRLGNLIVDGAGLAAVIDWELAHLGDPVEDLGWLCVKAWRFGAAPPVAGLGEREELVAAYEQESGRSVSLELLRWFEVLGTLKWGIMCLMQTDGHRSGLRPSVELAAIGRRVAENEWDLLDLLAPETGPASLSVPVAERPTPGEPHPDDALHGVPTAPELIEAVRGFLEAEAFPHLEGRARFLTRVSMNVLDTVRRELVMADEQDRARRRRLAELGVASERELADGVRAGRFDERRDELTRSLRATAADRLAVANPRYLG